MPHVLTPLQARNEQDILRLDPATLVWVARMVSSFRVIEMDGADRLDISAAEKNRKLGAGDALAKVTRQLQALAADVDGVRPVDRAMALLGPDGHALPWRVR